NNGALVFYRVFPSGWSMGVLPRLGRANKPVLHQTGRRYHAFTGMAVLILPKKFLAQNSY
ncbi:MAG: hypothetical protein ACK5JB_02835, partial [Pseudanabaena sp.]